MRCIQFLLLSFSLIFSGLVLADSHKGKAEMKPESAQQMHQKTKQSKEEKRAMKAEKQALKKQQKNQVDEDDQMKQGQGEKQHGADDAGSQPQKGLLKQKAMKTEQERKELGKGSEKGQQQREEHSKKWWKFWE